jgi:polyhydroxybutyrate depolymerase
MSGMARMAAAGIVLLVLVLFVLVNVARGQGRVKEAKAGADHTGSIVHGGLKRTYLLHVPKGFDKAKQWPLVFGLHGGGGDGSKVAKLTGFSAKADSAGFVVCYPDAVNHHWNDGRQVRRFKAQRDGVDDVGFIAVLTDRFVKDLNVDPGRVYATGISNGGMMCYRLGCELADRIAAIAPVAAAMPEPLGQALGTVPGFPPEILGDSPRSPRRSLKPMPVLAINGTEDPLVPYEGGGVGLRHKRGQVLSVQKTIEFWVAADSCGPKPETTEIPDVDPHDGIRVVRERYIGGRDSSEVILYRVEGGGHTWPSGARRVARFGKTARDIDATEVIWEFFARHTR